LIVVEREASASAIFITKTSSQTINHVDVVTRGRS